MPHAVASAELARSLLGRQSIDLLLLDLNLPGESGLSLLRGIRAGGGTAPAIFLTGYGTLDVARHAISLDAVNFLLKPCTLQELEQAIARALRRLDGLAVTSDAFHASDALQSSMDGADAGNEAVAPRAGELLEDLERRAILLAVERHDGNRSAAARELGISERKLYYKLKQFKQHEG